MVREKSMRYNFDCECVGVPGKLHPSIYHSIRLQFSYAGKMGNSQWPFMRSIVYLFEFDDSEKVISHPFRLKFSVEHFRSKNA